MFLFYKCKFDLFDDSVLIKNVVVKHKNTKLTLKHEIVEEDQIENKFSQLVSRWDSHHSLNIYTVYSDLSFGISLDSTDTASDPIILSDMKNISR